jgi:hypothetical protein
MADALCRQIVDRGMFRSWQDKDAGMEVRSVRNGDREPRPRGPALRGAADGGS